MKISILVVLGILFTSCLKQEESIDPFVEPKSLSQVQRDLFANVAADGLGGKMNRYQPKYSFDESKPDVFFLKVEYNFNNIDINSLGEGNENFEILANKFVVFFAKAFFSMGGSYQIDLEEIELEIPALDIDRDIVSAIYLDGARLEYSNRSKHYFGKNANFEFIDKFEISAPYRIPDSNTTIDMLLFSYEHDRNNCNYECVEMDIFTYNVLDLIGENTVLKLKPEMTVQSLPVDVMEFSGSIDIVVELKLPF